MLEFPATGHVAGMLTAEPPEPISGVGRGGGRGGAGNASAELFRGGGGGGGHGSAARHVADDLNAEGSGQPKP